MSSPTVKVDCSLIRDWPSFHEVFANALGFPPFYGRNMDAWIDCMTSLDAPDDGLSSVHCGVGSVVTIQLDNIEDFRLRCPEQYAALIECAAFVNWRSIKVGDPAVLALSFFR